MGRTGGRLASSWVLSVVLLGPRLAMAGTDPPEVVLHIDNRAGVPHEDLARAMTDVARVFEAAGVETAWVEGRLSVAVSALNSPGASTRHVAVLLVNNHDDPTRGAKGCALGIAMPAIATAYVFYNRIVETSLTRPVDVSAVLGRVMTHEFGHLLLPPGSHSQFGIMRADLDLGYGNPTRFADDQARRMQAGLVTRSTGE